LLRDEPKKAERVASKRTGFRPKGTTWSRTWRTMVMDACRTGDVFLLRLRGVSMSGDAMLEGDIAAVRRSRQPNQGAIVVATVDGLDTVSTVHCRGVRELVGAHPDRPPRRMSVRNGWVPCRVVVELVRLYFRQHYPERLK